jgi:type I restriction enzyme R subunit
MRKALKDYAQGQDGQGDIPVQEKGELFKLLDDAINQGTAFCMELGINVGALLQNQDVFKNIDAFRQYADTLLIKDEWRKGFAVYENTITGLYEACKPEILGKPVVRSVAVFQYLRGVLDAIIEQKDLDAVGIRIGELLDESLVVDGGGKLKEGKPGFRIIQSGKTWDLSTIDFERLKEDFEESKYKNIEISDLRAFIGHKMDHMLQENATRTDFATRLQGIIDEYNAGSSSADNYFAELVKFTKDLKEESERHIREGLTEDELELFDLLQKDKMTKEETQKVRLAARSLLHRLREESPNVLVTDWFRDSQSRGRVRSAVESVLNEHLPGSYDRVVFTEKCNNILDLMVDYASQGLKWAT